MSKCTVWTNKGGIFLVTLVSKDLEKNLNSPLVVNIGILYEPLEHLVDEGQGKMIVTSGLIQFPVVCAHTLTHH